MAMYVKITTDCGFMGCETVRIVKVDDQVTEEYLEEITADFLEGDIQPSSCYEILDEAQVDEEIEDLGCQIVDLTTEEE